MCHSTWAVRLYSPGGSSVHLRLIHMVLLPTRVHTQNGISIGSAVCVGAFCGLLSNYFDNLFSYLWVSHLCQQSYEVHFVTAAENRMNSWTHKWTHKTSHRGIKQTQQSISPLVSAWIIVLLYNAVRVAGIHMTIQDHSIWILFVK